MRIGIQTWGSEGDISPFIALAGGLAHSGHDVNLAITSAERKDYREVATRLGFNLWAVDYIADSEEELNDLGKKMITISNPLKQLEMIFDEMFEPGVDSMYKTSESLCECSAKIGFAEKMSR
jgi:UDP:flavonoid glycosyltransferase YjiC (YdhE family)